MMMKTRTRKSLLTIAAILLALVAAPMSNALAEGNEVKVVPPDDVVFGMTYGDWSAAWWQWVLSIPMSENPQFDLEGEKCAVGQSSSPVFFLVGAFEDEIPETPSINDVERTCIVPANRYLFFPIVNVSADNTGPPSGDFFVPTEAGQRDTAALYANLIDLDSLSLTVTVDGVLVEPVAEEDFKDFRAQSPSFNFSLPPKNIQGVAPKAKGHYFGVTDGYYMMLEPLSPREDGNPIIINFKGRFALDGETIFALDVTYNILVGE